MQHRTARRQFPLSPRRAAACVAVAAFGGLVGVAAASAGEPTTTTTAPAPSTTAGPTTTAPAPPTTAPPCWRLVDPSGATTTTTVAAGDVTVQVCEIDAPAPADPIDGPPNTTG